MGGQFSGEKVVSFQAKKTDGIKEIIINENQCIALVSAEKMRINFEDKNEWSKLLKRNDYNKWEIVNIDYWIHDKNGDIAEGNLYSK